MKYLHIHKNDINYLVIFIKYWEEKLFAYSSIIWYCHCYLIMDLQTFTWDIIVQNLKSNFLIIYVYFIRFKLCHLKAAKIHIAREGDESGTPLYQGLGLPFPDDCSRGKQDGSW